MRKYFLFTAALLLLCGCTKLKQLQYLPQLLTLKAVSDQGELTKADVKEQDSHFELILKDSRSGKLNELKNKTEVLSQYGAPVFSRFVDENGKVLEQALYRYSTNFFDSPKVYLYYDDQGQIIRWEVVEISK